MITLKQTIEGCRSSEKMAWEKSDPITYYIERPISYLVTWPLLNTPITANAVSFFSIIVSLVALGLLSFGNSFAFRIIGWSLLFFWSILDCVDGNIARFKKTASSNGELWDATAGYIAMCVLFVSPAMVAFFEKPLIEISFLNPIVYPFLGSVSVICSLIPRIIMHKKSATSDNATDEFKNRSSFSVVKIIVNNIMSITGLPLILLLPCLIFGLCNIFTIVYCFFNIAICFYSLFKLLRRKKHD